jgi:hypothetical protein
MTPRTRTLTRELLHNTITAALMLAAILGAAAAIAWAWS